MQLMQRGYLGGSHPSGDDYRTSWCKWHMTMHAYEWKAAKLAEVQLAGVVLGRPVWRGSKGSMTGFYKLMSWYEEMYEKNRDTESGDAGERVDEEQVS